MDELDAELSLLLGMLCNGRCWRFVRSMWRVMAAIMCVLVRWYSHCLGLGVVCSFRKSGAGLVLSLDVEVFMLGGCLCFGAVAVSGGLLHCVAGCIDRLMEGFLGVFLGLLRCLFTGCVVCKFRLVVEAWVVAVCLVECLGGGECRFYGLVCVFLVTGVLGSLECWLSGLATSACCWGRFVVVPSLGVVVVDFWRVPGSREGDLVGVSLVADRLMVWESLVWGVIEVGVGGSGVALFGVCAVYINRAPEGGGWLCIICRRFGIMNVVTLSVFEFCGVACGWLGALVVGSVVVDGGGVLWFGVSGWMVYCGEGSSLLFGGGGRVVVVVEAFLFGLSWFPEESRVLCYLGMGLGLGARCACGCGALSALFGVSGGSCVYLVYGVLGVPGKSRCSGGSAFRWGVVLSVVALWSWLGGRMFDAGVVLLRGNSACENNPTHRSFDDYKWEFNLEIDKLADEYELGIGKKGRILDHVWEYCNQVHNKNYEWHNYEFENEEYEEIGIEDKEYHPPEVQVETFEVKRYSFKGGQSFICVTKDLDNTLPLGRKNGSKFKKMI
ncbi:hypothetical protein Tco_0652327 [Tanacetum coccineum]|uniref:Uncharacterized protein n=1 Tax=Tanacetum coccineum TaxID=301880 RepID=A0ABQ4WXI9_9ASTR